MTLRFTVFLLLGLLNTAARGSTTTVPIQLIGNLPIVTARIDGIDVPLVFDLGDSSALVLSQKILDRVKTLPSSETNRSTDVQGNVIQSPKFKLPLLQIGQASFINVHGRVDSHDPSYLPTDVGQQGYFGTSLVKSYKVVLDYPHRKMTLISGTGQSAKCRGIVVPFLSDWNGLPVTKANTDFGELKAMWDTGSTESILRRAGSQKISNAELTETVSTKRLDLGGMDFGPLTLSVADYAEPAGTDMFIGYNFFAKHVVCIDFPGHRFLILH